MRDIVVNKEYLVLEAEDKRMIQMRIKNAVDGAAVAGKRFFRETAKPGIRAMCDKYSEPVIQCLIPIVAEKTEVKLVKLAGDKAPKLVKHVPTVVKTVSTEVENSLIKSFSQKTNRE